MLMSYLTCIFPMNPHVLWSVGPSVGRLSSFPKKSREVTLPMLLGALVHFMCAYILVVGSTVITDNDGREKLKTVKSQLILVETRVEIHPRKARK